MSGDTSMRAFAGRLAAPEFGDPAFITPVPLARAKVAIVTSAALHTPDDERFTAGDTSFRLIDRRRRDLALGHWMVC